MPIRAENRHRYPKDWALRSRFVRFYRAKNHCEWCGAKNGDPHPVSGSIVVLTTAHVHDDRPEACSLLNLAALCQKCHNGHDAAARQRRRRARLGRPEPIDERQQRKRRQLLWARRALGFTPSPAERRAAAMAKRQPGA